MAGSCGVISGGGGYFIVGREPDERRASQTNAVMAAVAAAAAAAAFLGNDRTQRLRLRHVPHAPLTTGFIVCFANLNAA